MHVGLSGYETSYHLVLAQGVVLGCVALICGYPWLHHYRRSVGLPRHRRNRIRPVGTVGSAG